MQPTSEKRAGIHPLVLGARYGFLVVAWLFMLAVVAQFFLIGLSFFTTLGFEPHIELGHTFSLLIIVLFLLSLAARLPLKIVGLIALLFVLYGLQYVFAEVAQANPSSLGWLFAFHPVNALIIFGLGTFLVRQARQFLPRPLGTLASAQPPAAQVPAGAEVAGD
ncbi:MAG TPA: DUF6220 domain-containing protein [Ktedonobacterales bacterium]|jgi:hypothetical protein